jgi:hypothetical protein
LSRRRRDAPFDSIWVHKEPMVMFNVAMMELKHKRPLRQQPFVVPTYVITRETKELLITAARRLDVAYGDCD